MQTQSAKTPIPSESVTITPTPEEQDFVIWALDCYFRVTGSKAVLNLVRKIEFLKKSGDACRHSAQSSDAVGQGGIILDTPMNRVSVPPEAIYEDSLEAPGQGGFICYECENRVSCLFDDSRCKYCTRLTPEEVQGNVRQGGNQ